MILSLILGIIALILCVVFILDKWDVVDSIFGHIWLCIYAPILAGMFSLCVSCAIGGVIGIFPEKNMF